ncbi:MAG: hypothetical protein LBB41_06930 [Prevotellaceae bacterium]|nr:hypothetical protein [Prevotellaceae bacterium]
MILKKQAGVGEKGGGQLKKSLIELLNLIEVMPTVKKDIIPDILNSRNERVILELPNYAYCYSSQTQGSGQSFFLGRQSRCWEITSCRRGY